MIDSAEKKAKNKANGEKRSTSMDKDLGHSSRGIAQKSNPMGEFTRSSRPRQKVASRLSDKADRGTLVQTRRKAEKSRNEANAQDLKAGEVKVYNRRSGVEGKNEANFPVGLPRHPVCRLTGRGAGCGQRTLAPLNPVKSVKWRKRSQLGISKDWPFHDLQPIGRHQTARTNPFLTVSPGLLFRHSS